MNGSTHRGAAIGLAAAALVVALMFAVRLTLDVRALPDVAADAMTLVLPGSVFGLLIDRLQEYGRPLLLIGLSLGLLVLGGLVGAMRARYLAARPLFVRLALPTLALCALTLPAVFIGAADELASVPALTTVAYWSLFSVLLNTGLSRRAAQPLMPVGGPSRRALLYGAAALGMAWLGSYLGGRVLTASAKVGRRPAVAATAAPTLAPATDAGAPARSVRQHDRHHDDEGLLRHLEERRR